ncbi:MAG: 3-deoxy-D-manno-octulosonic acid transferase [Deltaproteobacteria bacterium]
MHIVYQIASMALFALVWPLLIIHPKLRHGLRQRWGLHGGEVCPGGGSPRIWLHGASAGDLLALSPVIDGLRRRFPTCTLIVSTITNSGHLMARERIRGADAVIYLPYDLPGATRRAVEAIRPDLLVLEYTEIWPALIRAVRRSGARIALTNGRFSSRYLRRYRWLFWLIGNPLAEIDLFLMREEVEAERAILLGAPLERVWVTGNTKFDALLFEAPSADDPSLAVALGGEGPLWIAGSTHEGEEALLLAVLAKLRAEQPRLRLAIAPRYIERAGRVLSMARERGFSARLRSQEALPGAPADVIVLDSMGELGKAYRLATLVFVGGSFTERGGQNILEPAAAGKPVLFGPNMDNFHDSVQVLVGRGGIQVKDEEQLERVVSNLLSKPDRMTELGSMARAAVAAVQGAGQRDVEHLCRLLDHGGDDRRVA